MCVAGGRSRRSQRCLFLRIIANDICDKSCFGAEQISQWGNFFVWDSRES